MASPLRRTRLDLVVTAVVVITVVVVGVVLWVQSPERRVRSEQAAIAAPELVPLSDLPKALTQRWAATNTVPGGPAITDRVVATADGSTITAHDPLTGATVWSYSRPGERACALLGYPVSGGQSLIIAAFEDARGCGDVMSFAAATGQRIDSRTSDADKNVALSTDGTYILSQGSSRIEAWGSNLVSSFEFGRITGPQNPDPQRKSDCQLESAQTGGGRIAIVSRCPGEVGYRLTMVDARLDDDGKLWHQTTAIITTSVAIAPPQVLAVSATSASVFIPADPTSPNPDLRVPTVTVYANDTTALESRRVTVSPTLPADSRPTQTAVGASYFTGEATVLLDPNTLGARLETKGTRGPATSVGFNYAAATADGIVELDTRGTQIAGTKVDPATRASVGTSTIYLAIVGSMVVQYWGNHVSVLGAA